MAGAADSKEGAAAAPKSDAPISRASFLGFLASLTVEEKAEYGLAPAPAVARSTTPKFSEHLDRVKEEDIAKVVQACRKGISHVAANAQDPNAQAQALEHLQQVSPSLAQAASTNSLYRGKPIVHSLHVAAQYLQSPEAHAKREAAKRRVPVER
jgi:hypothetical protein